MRLRKHKKKEGDFYKQIIEKQSPLPIKQEKPPSLTSGGVIQGEPVRFIVQRSDLFNTLGPPRSDIVDSSRIFEISRGQVPGLYLLDGHRKILSAPEGTFDFSLEQGMDTQRGHTRNVRMSCRILEIPITLPPENLARRDFTMYMITRERQVWYGIGHVIDVSFTAHRDRFTMVIESSQMTSYQF